MTAGKLKLIIFHYHLLPGGVTDVIKHSLTAFVSLPGISSVEIVCGREENIPKMSEAVQTLSRSGISTPVKITVLPAIDYLNLQTESPDPQRLKNLLLNRYSSPDSVWLIHNYHLGKNWTLTAALNQIARDGHQKIIYQIHDFPECARFANLNELKSNIRGTLYPVSDSLRYCVINMRDFNIMKEAGIPGDSLFLLENPLPRGSNTALHQADSRELKKKLKALRKGPSVFHSEGELWLYPVRSIRRKNILEGGLITAMTENPVNLILTLPGISPQEKNYSNLCEKAFARGLIPGYWGTGILPDTAGISYNDLISASDLIFSSSVQEGFGYMYLNALLWQKPLLARYLDIMDGFLPLMDGYPAHFYKSVLIPAGTALKKQLNKEYSLRFQELESYLPDSIKKALLDDLDSLTSKDSVDFSYLSPEMQYTFLSELKSEILLSECRDLNQDFMTEISKLMITQPGDRKTQLYEGYGEEAYAEAFNNILDSFEKPLKTPEPDDNRVDDGLLLRFSRSEFFRLLYR